MQHPKQAAPAAGISPAAASIFLTENDLAARQARSVKTIRNDRVKGAGAPFVKIGRLVRYRLSDVMTWEDANLRRSTSDTGGADA